MQGRAYRKLFILQCLLWILSSFYEPCTAQDPATGRIQISYSQLIDTLKVIHGLDFAYDALAINADSVILADPADFSDKGRIVSFFENDTVEVNIIGSQVIIGRKAQKDDPLPGIITVSGTVVDAASLMGIPGVNIFVEGHALGTSTNLDGHFVFKIPATMAGQHLLFSALGYQGTGISIPETDTTIEIGMKSHSIWLPEVRITSVDPLRVVREVERRSKANYSSDHMLLTGFFRETIKQNGHYVDVSEAVIEIVKPPYNRISELEKVRFVKGRKGSETSAMDLVRFRLVGGPYYFSQLDIIRNGDFLPKAELAQEYKYSYNGMDEEFGKPVYRIGFKPESDKEGIYYEGEMRIDTVSLGMVSIDFKMTEPSLKRSRSMLIKRDAKRFKTKPYYARYLVQYRPWNGIWVLSNVKGELSVRIYDRSEKEKSVFETVSELLITDFEPTTGRIRFPASEYFRPAYSLSDQIGEFDPDFWKFYNVISPDEALESVLKQRNPTE